MTASPLDKFEKLAARFSQPHPAVLTCGQAILDWIRDLPRATQIPGYEGTVSAALLMGLRVVPDHSLDPGAWQVHDQYGNLLSEDRVGEPGEFVMWDSGQFVGIEPGPFATGDPR
jgi:hypothetical protein